MLTQRRNTYFFFSLDGLFSFLLPKLHKAILKQQKEQKGIALTIVLGYFRVYFATDKTCLLITPFSADKNEKDLQYLFVS